MKEPRRQTDVEPSCPPVLALEFDRPCGTASDRHGVGFAKHMTPRAERVAIMECPLITAAFGAAGIFLRLLPAEERI